MVGTKWWIRLKPCANSVHWPRTDWIPPCGGSMSNPIRGPRPTLPFTRHYWHHTHGSWDWTYPVVDIWRTGSIPIRSKRKRARPLARLQYTSSRCPIVFIHRRATLIMINWNGMHHCSNLPWLLRADPHILGTMIMPDSVPLPIWMVRTCWWIWLTFRVWWRRVNRHHHSNIVMS